MNLSEMLREADTRQVGKFYSAIQQRRDAIASNPAVNAAYQQRSIETGQLIATTADEGTVRTSYISSRSVGVGEYLPAVVRAGGSGWTDIKPS